MLHKQDILTIMVLKANEVIVAILTPFDRVLVSKTSAGTIQLSGPQPKEKEKLKSQVITMNPHWAPIFSDSPGGNRAIRMAPMMNVTMLKSIAPMSTHLRPV